MTDNMRFLGFSARAAAGSLSLANSDIAFQGKTAYQGTFPGFRIIDIRKPSNPREIINYENCRHPSGQGDVVIYKDVMTRSWDSASSNGMPAGGWPCGDSDGTVQAGEEGLHVIDVSDPEEPDVEAFIDLPCGSHTASGVPDPKNKRLIVYSTPSSGACDGIDVIEIPLRDPSAATYHHFEAAADLIACHDTGVILGKVLRAACAGGQGFAVWSMDPDDGGSLIDPVLLYTKNMKAEMGININTGHSAGVLQRRQDDDLRPRAERRRASALPGDRHGPRRRDVSRADRRHEVAVLLRHRDGRAQGPVDPAACRRRHGRTAPCTTTTSCRRSSATSW